MANRSPNDKTKYAGRGRRSKDSRRYMGAKSADPVLRDMFWKAIKKEGKARGHEFFLMLAGKLYEDNNGEAIHWAKLLLPIFCVPSEDPSAKTIKKDEKKGLLETMPFLKKVS